MFETGEKDRHDLALFMVIGAFVLVFIASWVMTNFLRFHIKLIRENKTTIEFLEKKGEEFQSPYDVGSHRNFLQVFGRQKILWPFPVYMLGGHPVGDGVFWPTPT